MEIVLFIASTIGMLWLAKKAIQNWREDREAQEDADFDLLTVAEKVEVVHRTTADLNSMEQLITDLDTCSEERQTVLRLQWLGEDGQNHTYDLYCDGMNTATECLREIAERETNDLRSALAYQCEVLADSTRSRKNGGKIGYKSRGEC